MTSAQIVLDSRDYLYNDVTILLIINVVACYTVMFDGHMRLYSLYIHLSPLVYCTREFILRLLELKIDQVETTFFCGDLKQVRKSGIHFLQTIFSLNFIRTLHVCMNNNDAAKY